MVQKRIYPQYVWARMMINDMAFVSGRKRLMGVCFCAPTLPAGGNVNSHISIHRVHECYALLHGLRFLPETLDGRMLLRPTLPAGGIVNSHRSIQRVHE